MLKKMVIFSMWNPTDEFLNFIKSLGYENYKDFDCMFDERVVKFVEEHYDYCIERNGVEYKRYKGREDHNFRVGYCGAAHVVEVDTSKTWRISESSYPTIGFPIIEYIDVNINKYNNVSITKK